jgi:predicted RNA-binding protein associated with RNAse of E/G family
LGKELALENLIIDNYKNENILKYRIGKLFQLDSFNKSTFVLITWDNNYFSVGKMFDNKPYDIWKTYDSKNRLRGYIFFGKCHECHSVIYRININKKGIAENFPQLGFSF